jgi:patatin-like phospholipase/acyl hydrolase
MRFCDFVHGEIWTMKLLAIDGGGIRGIYASHVLERVQKEFNTEFHREFDLIAGTSTGLTLPPKNGFLAEV